MKLNCMMILKNNGLSLQLNENIQNNITLKLMSTNEPLNSLLKTPKPMDILFFEMAEDCDSDFEKILSLSPFYQSLVLIINRTNCNIESHIFSDIDYLFTPFNSLEFDLLIKRIHKKIWDANIRGSFKSEYFFFQNKNDLSETIKCHYDEIAFIEAQNKSVKIYTDRDDPFLADTSMMRIQSKALATGLFIRVHRSFLVNKKRIESYKGNEIKIYGYKNPAIIGDTYRKRFIEYINLNRI